MHNLKRIKNPLNTTMDFRNQNAIEKDPSFVKQDTVSK
jgi:hypothetical protein